MGRVGHAQEEDQAGKGGGDKVDVRQDRESEGTKSKDHCEGLLRQGPEGQHLRWQWSSTTSKRCTLMREDRLGQVQAPAPGVGISTAVERWSLRRLPCVINLVPS